MEIEVGEVYKCGGTYVRILVDMREKGCGDKSFIPILGVECYADGQQRSCSVGMFDIDGVPFYGNPIVLKYYLQPIKSEQQIKIEELEQTIIKAQQQINELKKEIK